MMIKQHALNYQEHRYEMSIMLDSLQSIFNLKQKDGDLLQDYTNDLKQLVMYYVLILEDQLY